jgi:hypothetical protein
VLRPALVIIAFALVTVGSARQPAARPAPSPPLPVVLSRAATYVERFADRFSGFVMAETYVQEVFPPVNRFGSRPGGVRPYTGPVRRELKSDLLLVKPIGADGWMQFRDVTEVDGRRLKDRNNRLAKLFLEPSKSTATQARKIMQESSRYNIGDIERNINLPVLALVVLDRAAQGGFRFSVDRSDDKFDLPKSAAFAPPADALLVSFTETQLRTMVASPQGKNLASSGRFWFDPAISRIHMTEIGIDDLWLKAVIHVAYGPADGIDMPVPVEMHERYENKLNGTRVEGSATYSDFRQFKVAVDEDIAPIDDKGRQR